MNTCRKLTPFSLAGWPALLAFVFCCAFCRGFCHSFFVQAAAKMRIYAGGMEVGSVVATACYPMAFPQINRLLLARFQCSCFFSPSLCYSGDVTSTTGPLKHTIKDTSKKQWAEDL